MTARKLKITCLASLLLALAALGAAAWWQHGLAQSGPRLARAVGAARQQDMLAYKIITMAEHFAPERHGAQQEMQDAVTRMAQNHEALTAGALAPRPGDPLYDYISAHYAGGTEAALRQYLADAAVFIHETDTAKRDFLRRNMRQTGESVLFPRLAGLADIYAQNGAERMAALDRMAAGALAAALLAALFQAFAVALPAARHIARQDKSISDMASTDGLTGAYNRRMLLRIASILLSNARRQKAPVGMLLLDIDGFGALKDRYGHSAGDALIRSVAGAVARALRHGDVLGRVGSAEFAVVLPNTSAESAVYVAEKLRAAVAETPFRVKDEDVPLRASVGVAMTNYAEKHPDELLRKADAALAAARAQGGGRVASHPAAAPARTGEGAP